MDDLEKRIERLEQQSLFDEIKQFRLSGRTKSAIGVSLILSLTNSVRSNLVARFDAFIQEGGSEMDLQSFLRPDFVTIALFLWILGAILKYRTKVSNNGIPLILFGVSFVISAVWGYFTSGFIGSTRWVDALLICGVVHGVIVTAIAAYGWDIVNGLKKGLRK